MKLCLLFLLLFTAAPARADTSRAKCQAQVVAKDSWISSQIKLVQKTGKLAVKTWITKSEERAFGPTIYNHMWYSTKNGKPVAQMCARCYLNRIFEDDAFVDVGAYEKAGPCFGN